MRIVLLQSTFNPTTIGWVRGLESRGHAVLTLISRANEPFGGWPEDLAVTVVPDTVRWVERLGAALLPSRKSSTYRVPSPTALRRVLIDFGAEAVIVKIHSLRNVLVLLIAARLRLRRVAWIEQVPPPNLEWRILRILRVLPRKMFTALDTRPGGIADPLDPPVAGMPVITYAPVVPELLPSRTDRRDADSGEARSRGARVVRLLTVASFWDAENKRQLWTLEAARRCDLLGGEVSFTFAGVGKERSSGVQEIRHEADRLGITSAVDVRLNVPYVDMPRVYAEHDVLVLASRREQFGMVVPEAMAHGLVVIASATVGSIGCVVPGVTGEVFDVDDLNGLVEALRRVVNDSERRERMSVAAREFIITHGSPDVTARAIEHLLQ